MPKIKVKAPEAIKLIDDQDRKKLGEGRNCGFGGGFAKFNPEKNTVEMVMPITACADFYAEVVHTEATGKEWAVYGFKYKKADIFKDATHAYLVCGILPYNGSFEKHPNYDKEYKALEANWKHIQTFINWFEDKLGVKNKTEITRLGDNRYLFKFDLFWTQGTYRISLYKFLSRAPIYFDSTQEPMAHLDAMKDGEVYAWNAIKPKVLDMLSGFIPVQEMKATDGCPHHIGIQNFVWPRELEVKKS